jgi:hypothetical protein
MPNCDVFPAHAVAAGRWPWRWPRPAAGPGEEKVLNVYNWSDYIAEDTIKNFEKETGIKVRYDNFDNNEIVHAKLVAGKTGYDIVVPVVELGQAADRRRPAAQARQGQIPNLKNLDPAVQKQLAKMDPGNDYMVNWLWGYTTVGINVDKVKAALGSTPMPDNVWDLVFKPEYISKLKGCGVSFLDSPPRSCRRRCTTWASRRSARTRPTTPPRPAAQERAPARHAVQLVGLHQRHGQRLDLPGAGLVGRHQHRAPARHRRQDRPEHPGPDAPRPAACCSST